MGPTNEKECLLAQTNALLNFPCWHSVIIILWKWGNPGCCCPHSVCWFTVTDTTPHISSGSSRRESKGGTFLVARRSPSNPEDFGSFCVILCLCPHQPQSCESFHAFWQLHASLLQVCVESNMFGHSSSSSVRFSNRSWGNEWGIFGAFLRTHSPSWCSLFPKLLYLSIKCCLCIKLTIIIVLGRLWQTIITTCLR